MSTAKRVPLPWLTNVLSSLAHYDASGRIRKGPARELELFCVRQTGSDELDVALNLEVPGQQAFPRRLDGSDIFAHAEYDFPEEGKLVIGCESCFWLDSSH